MNKEYNLYVIYDKNKKQFYVEDGEFETWDDKPICLIESEENAQTVIDHLVEDCCMDDVFEIKPIKVLL